ncbi:MAG: hypothetical protein ACQEQF_00360 [Bacillota bacterium]
MNYPYYKCMECGGEIAELSLPIHPAQQYPKCNKCHTNKNVDIVLGDENTVVSEDMIIFSDDIKKVRGDTIGKYYVRSDTTHKQH